MSHVPHVHLPGPWEGDSIPLDAGHSHHLDRVLRLRIGDTVSYTDGEGRVGEGKLGDGMIVRGPEREVPPPSRRLTVAVAPPDSRERLRFLVEKLGELGVARLVWLRTRRGEGRPPRPEKAAAWAVSALEQSRGAWLLRIAESAEGPGAVDGPLLVAQPGGEPLGEVADGGVTLAVGPEGGWDPDEIPSGCRIVSLGDRILRVETAAVVGAARLLLP